MLRGKEDKRLWPLLAWCFATLLVVAQFQIGAHIHDFEDDASVIHECALCVASSNLDDIDTVEVSYLIDYRQAISSVPQRAILSSEWSSWHAHARAPPFS